jgi:hypothetical protein
MTGFTAHFDTARDYNLQFTVKHTHKHAIVHSHVFIAVTW